MTRSIEFWTTIATALLLGTLGVLLSVWGNPENSGICVSCFIENSAGALGLHDNTNMQYLRPELIGFVLGSTASAIAFRDFQSRGGSAPLSRLFLGIFLIFGCAVFIGCPIKLFLRLSAGDLTAVAGVAGLLAGVWMGLKGLARGVELVRQDRGNANGGHLMPILFVLLLVFLITRPGFLLFSAKGGGAQYAPWLLALGAGVGLGALAQRTRFCITGSIRNTFLMGLRVPAIWGLLAFIAAAAVANLATGRFNLGLYGQPGAHLEYVWSFLGMGLVGWISVLIGGCPFRQLIKAGEGDADAGLVVIGMFIGGALSQSWGIAATAAGVPLYGKVAILLGFASVACGSLVCRDRT
ncbi:YedE family putative selenium transporter [Pelotalea chapellei]|uniref:YedE-related selenium metabolism membrane protein n=1 Tax=Pelotalea chapellei TaxID=44671 RepID=A0ABS5UA29_9BACT|nr:YedE family putative selenium transporter [Pelotalea chapellei]MBT1072522.1 YedE-related selenium metabolism membrane protein [Pelotalea chapellei]